MKALLGLDHVSAGYGASPVLRDVTLEIQAGEVVALLGANGAGKTTLLRTAVGQLTPAKGDVIWDSAKTRQGLARRVRDGLGYVTESRSVIMQLSVRDNLRLARSSVDRALELFPPLGPLLSRRAGLLSGGEQQMLALARALARRPRALVVDELSLGLAPLVVRDLLAAIRAAADDGTAVLLVEEGVHRALGVSDRAYVLRLGHIALSGTSGELLARVEEIERLYLSETSLIPHHSSGSSTSTTST
jgi:branched-chain amino acid transport system ATP-binding protein